MRLSMWMFLFAQTCLKQVKTQVWDGFTRDNHKLKVQIKDIKYDVFVLKLISKSSVTSIMIYHQINK